MCRASIHKSDISSRPTVSIKEYTMRETGKIVGKTMPSMKYLNGKNHTISRYRFDKNLYDRGSDPWLKVDLAKHGANGIEVETKPFGKGELQHT